MLQDTVWLITVLLMASILGVFVFVAANAQRPAADYATLQTHAYGIRKKLFWFLLLGSGIVIIATTQSLPYFATHNVATSEAMQIDVVGRQWSWQLSSNQATVGEPVMFNVTSADVNHGIGIYNSDSQLLAQTQAMPKYTNRLRVTFEKPGEYRLLCMEYCGVAHHGMIAVFNVVAK